MEEGKFIVLSAIGAYFILMIVFGILAGRKQSHEGFVIGSRNVGYIPTLGSLASSFRDGMGVVFWFGFGASVGYGGLWLFLGVIVGLFVYAFIGPKVRKVAKEHDQVTIGELIRARLGAVSERFTALITILVALMLISIQLYVSGHLFSVVLGVEPWVGVWSVAFIVAFYLFFGGYATVVKTDAVQFFIIISMIVVPFFFRPSAEDVMNLGSLFSLGWNDSAALAIIGFFYVLSAADTWQRVFSARDDKVVKVSFPLSGVFLIIMTLSLIYLGMASKPYLGDAIDTDKAFYEIFKGDFIPPLLLAYIATIVMAICMSTMDTMSYLTAATISKNFLPPKVTEDRAVYVKFVQGIVLLILVAMSIVALTISNVILFLFNVISLLYIVAPVYVFTAFGFPKEKSMRTDVLVSISVAVCCILYIYLFVAEIFDKNMMYLNIPVLLSTVLVSLSLFIGGKLSRN